MPLWVGSSSRADAGLGGGGKRERAPSGSIMLVSNEQLSPQRRPTKRPVCPSHWSLSEALSIPPSESPAARLPISSGTHSSHNSEHSLAIDSDGRMGWDLATGLCDNVGRTSLRVRNATLKRGAGCSAKLEECIGLGWIGGDCILVARVILITECIPTVLPPTLHIRHAAREPSTIGTWHDQDSPCNPGPAVPIAVIQARLNDRLPCVSDSLIG
ncbi:hypothetical protein C8F01DRAFT_636863 [Mycena amicta]|nr:hypothetical protein C8F01DRAFT_636863 [Mycena amicta]